MKVARSVKEVYKNNMVIDETKGIVHIGEVFDLILDGIDQVLEAGPSSS